MNTEIPIDDILSIEDLIYQFNEETKESLLQEIIDEPIAAGINGALVGLNTINVDLNDGLGDQIMSKESGDATRNSNGANIIDEPESINDAMESMDPLEACIKPESINDAMESMDPLEACIKPDTNTIPIKYENSLKRTGSDQTIERRRFDIASNNESKMDINILPNPIEVDGKPSVKFIEDIKVSKNYNKADYQKLASWSPKVLPQILISSPFAIQRPNTIGGPRETQPFTRMRFDGSKPASTTENLDLNMGRPTTGPGLLKLGKLSTVNYLRHHSGDTWDTIRLVGFNINQKKMRRASSFDQICIAPDLCKTIVAKIDPNVERNIIEEAPATPVPPKTRPSKFEQMELQFGIEGVHIDTPTSTLEGKIAMKPKTPKKASTFEHEILKSLQPSHDEDFSYDNIVADEQDTDEEKANIAIASALVRKTRIELDLLNSEVERNKKTQLTMLFSIESLRASTQAKQNALRKITSLFPKYQEQRRILNAYLLNEGPLLYQQEVFRNNQLMARANTMLQNLKRRKLELLDQLNDLKEEQSNNSKTIESLERRAQGETNTLSSLKNELKGMNTDYLQINETVTNRRDLKVEKMKQNVRVNTSTWMKDSELLMMALEKRRAMGFQVDNIRNMDTLILEGSNLTRIPVAQLDSTTVKHILVQNNKLTTLDQLNMFLDIESISTDGLGAQLSFLNAGGNLFTTMRGVENSPDLRILILKNSIVQDFSLMQKLSGLIYLDISLSKISDPEIVDFFSQCTLLQYLDLSNNILKTFPIISNPNLFELHLNSNMIIQLEQSLWLYNLRVLNLSDNLLTDIIPLAMCPFLQVLNLARNQIRDPKCVICISLCRQLHTLDMTGNTCIDSKVFEMYFGTLLCNIKRYNGKDTAENGPKFLKKAAQKTQLQRGKILETAAEYLLDYLFEQKEHFDYDDAFQSWEYLAATFEKETTHHLGKYASPYLNYLTAQDISFKFEACKNIELQERRRFWLIEILEKINKEAGFIPAISWDRIIYNHYEFLTNQSKISKIIFVQSMVRMKLKVMNYQMTRNGFIKLQRHFRKLKVYEKFSELAAILVALKREDDRRCHAAIKIQSIWRMFRSKKEYGHKLEEYLANKFLGDALLQEELDNEVDEFDDWINQSEMQLDDDNYEFMDYTVKKPRQSKPKHANEKSVPESSTYAVQSRLQNSKHKEYLADTDQEARLGTNRQQRFGIQYSHEYLAGDTPEEPTFKLPDIDTKEKMKILANERGLIMEKLGEQYNALPKLNTAVHGHLDKTAAIKVKLRHHNPKSGPESKLDLDEQNPKSASTSNLGQGEQKKIMRSINQLDKSNGSTYNLYEKLKYRKNNIRWASGNVEPDRSQGNNDMLGCNEEQQSADIGEAFAEENQDHKISNPNPTKNENDHAPKQQKFKTREKEYKTFIAEAPTIQKQFVMPIQEGVELMTDLKQFGKNRPADHHEHEFSPQRTLFEHLPNEGHKSDVFSGISRAIKTRHKFEDEIESVEDGRESPIVQDYNSRVFGAQMDAINQSFMRQTMPNTSDIKPKVDSKSPKKQLQERADRYEFLLDATSEHGSEDSNNEIGFFTESALLPKAIKSVPVLFQKVPRMAPVDTKTSTTRLPNIINNSSGPTIPVVKIIEQNIKQVNAFEEIIKQKEKRRKESKTQASVFTWDSRQNKARPKSVPDESQVKNVQISYTGRAVENLQNRQMQQNNYINYPVTLLFKPEISSKVREYQKVASIDPSQIVKYVKPQVNLKYTSNLIPSTIVNPLDKKDGSSVPFSANKY